MVTPSLRSKLAGLLLSASVEPVIFLHGLAESASESVHVSLKIDKVCRVGTSLFGDGILF